MNTTLLKPLNKAIILMLSFIFIFSCQNDDNDLQEAQFSNNPFVFTDNFIGLGSDFYFPYGGSKFTSFSVETPALITSSGNSSNTVATRF